MSGFIGTLGASMGKDGRTAPSIKEVLEEAEKRRKAQTSLMMNTLQGMNKISKLYETDIAPYAGKGVTYKKWLEGNHITESDVETQKAWIKYFPIFVEKWLTNTGLPTPDVILGVSTPNQMDRLYDEAMSGKVEREERASIRAASSEARLIQKTKENLINLYKKDWSYMSDEEKKGLILLWKSKHPGFTEGKNRELLFKNLMEDDFGSAYANVNNLNSYSSLNDSPIEPGKGIKEIEDEFYNVICVKSFTILEWYEHGVVKGYLWAGTKWGFRIRTPNPGAWASREARHIKGDLENNKYLITAAVVIGFGVSILAIVVGS